MREIQKPPSPAGGFLEIAAIDIRPRGDTAPLWSSAAILLVGRSWVENGAISDKLSAWRKSPMPVVIIRGFGNSGN